jgi:glycosyltransferase involved in cell wall biosynthesis
MTQPSTVVASRRLLYLDAYTAPVEQTSTLGSSPSSDAIGYAITSSAAIRTGLRAAGWEVLQPELSGLQDQNGGVRRLRWFLRAYESALDSLATSPPDVIFVFHAFSVFPTEIRRMILDLRLDMQTADLANLCVLDKVLLVSHQMQATLRASIGAFNEPLATFLETRYEVVGLPLDVARIDESRTDERDPRPTVVFNHAPVASKDPDMFVRVMRRILPRYDVGVLFTRMFPPDGAGGEAVAALAADFGDRVVLGNNMPLQDYYSALWRAELQVSTATHESLGVSTLEAMYTGTCCILPRIGSYPEIAGNHPDALYDRGDQQLEERLTYFLDHPERRRAVADDLQQAAARYRPDLVVRRIADVLDKVVSPGR